MTRPMQEPTASSSGGFSHVHPSQLSGGYPRSGHEPMFSNAFNVSPAMVHTSMPSTSAYTLNAGDLSGAPAKAEPRRRSPPGKQNSLAQQEQQQDEDDETLTPEEARRLKRKEQNKMAQRRHREKQRNQMNEMRRQRQGSNGEVSPPGSDSGDGMAMGSAFPGKQSAQHQEHTYSSMDAAPDRLSTAYASQHGQPAGQMGAGMSAQSASQQASNTHQHQHQQHPYLYQQSQGQQDQDHMHEHIPPPRGSDRDEGMSHIQVPSDQFDYSQLLVNDGSNSEHGQGRPSSSSPNRLTTRMHGLAPPQPPPLQDLSTIRPSDLHSGDMQDFFGSEDDTEPDSAASHDSRFGFQHLQTGGQDSSGPNAHGFFHQQQPHADGQLADVRASTSRLDLSDGHQHDEEHVTADSQGGKKRKHKGPGLAPPDNRNGSPGTGTAVSRPMSNAELLKYFASLTSLQMPWADQLLTPRWDLIKVLELASARLGLLFQYVEDDRSISFLANDFMSATQGLGRGPASSGPGQTELGKWPTEDEPDIRVPVGQSLSAAASMASAAAMGSNSDGGKGGSAEDGQGSSSSSAGPVLRWSHVPDNMRPCRLSGYVGHHPYIDLSFPWPVFRDRVLAAMSCHLLHEVDLCMEIWPGEDLQPVGAEPPYWIHGDDPFDPESYEVSDRFAKRYPWLLDAAIIRRTNWWRRQQSKPELPLMVTQVSRSFAPFFEQQIQHLTNPERVPPPGQLPQALNHLGIGSMIPPLNQLFGVNAQASFLQQQGGDAGGASISSMEDVMSGGGGGGHADGR